MLEGDILDLNSATMARRHTALQVVEKVDQALLKAQAERVERDYLGGSYVGNGCERAIQYQYLRTPKDEGVGFPANILRIFERGHRMEDMAAGWLRQAGFLLKTEGRDGRQFGFAVAGDRFKGHADGVLVDWLGEGPCPVALPALWEGKAMNAKNFGKMVKYGVKKTKPHYHAQVMLYQHYLQLEENPAVFTIVNANTMDLHVELIPFEPAECQRLIDRAARILTASEAGETLPRAYAEPDGFGCMFCDYKARCWA